MHPYLSCLGVSPEVQAFFTPGYSSDSAGNIIFDHGDSREVFGPFYNRIPLSENCWCAGAGNNVARRVLISGSAIDLIAWCNLYPTAMQESIFVSLGLLPGNAQFEYLRPLLSGKNCALFFPADLMGRVADLKTAAGILRMPAAVRVVDEAIKLTFRHKTYQFDRDNFSLSAVERATGYRFGIRTIKPKGFNTFFDQLKLIPCKSFPRKARKY